MRTIRRTSFIPFVDPRFRARDMCFTLGICVGACFEFGFGVALIACAISAIVQTIYDCWLSEKENPHVS